MDESKSVGWKVYILATLMSLFYALVVEIDWNLMTPLFHGPSITYPQAYVIVALVWVLYDGIKRLLKSVRGL